MLEEHADEVSRLGVEVRAVGRLGDRRARRARSCSRAPSPSGSCAISLAEVSRARGAPSAARSISCSRRWRVTARYAQATRSRPTRGQALLRALDEVDFAGHCPHGRPLVDTDAVRRAGAQGWSLTSITSAGSPAPSSWSPARPSACSASWAPRPRARPTSRSRCASAPRGEIISADSVQIYRGFDIGSGKPTAEERARAPHHLVDVLESARDCRRDDVRVARRSARSTDVRARGKVPVLCGGTFFWVRALVLGLAPAPAADEAVRARHAAIAERARARCAARTSSRGSTPRRRRASIPTTSSG